MEVLTKHGIRASPTVNSDVCVYHPEIIQECVKLGWELLGHNKKTASGSMPCRPSRAHVDQGRDGDPREDQRQAAGGLARIGVGGDLNTLDHLIDEGCLAATIRNGTTRRGPLSSLRLDCTPPLGSTKRTVILPARRLRQIEKTKRKSSGNRVFLGLSGGPDILNPDTRGHSGPCTSPTTFLYVGDYFSDTLDFAAREHGRAALAAGDMGARSDRQCSLRRWPDWRALNGKRLNRRSCLCFPCGSAAHRAEPQEYSCYDGQRLPVR